MPLFLFSSRSTLNTCCITVFCVWVDGRLAVFGEVGRQCCCRRFHSGVERDRLGALFGKDEVISIISG